MNESQRHTPLSRVEILESTLLDLVKELQSLRADLQKRSNEETLEDLLEAEDVARILGVEIAYVYSLARAEETPLNAESAVASTSETVAAASASAEQTHTPTFEESTQSRTDEKPVDPESEVAAFRDRDKKST